MLIDATYVELDKAGEQAGNSFFGSHFYLHDLLQIMDLQYKKS